MTIRQPASPKRPESGRLLKTTISERKCHVNRCFTTCDKLPLSHVYRLSLFESESNVDFAFLGTRQMLRMASFLG